MSKLSVWWHNLWHNLMADDFELEVMSAQEWLAAHSEVAA
jgi:hypothetical protein